MKILVSETVTHYHEIELSDELDIENILNMANEIKDRCDTGYDAIEEILSSIKKRYGDAFDYEIKPNFCGTKCEEIDYEQTLEE